jgi:hypothetical protein
MSLPDGQSATEIGAAVGNAVREHSTFFLIEGIILIILGALAIFLTPFATIAVGRPVAMTLRSALGPMVGCKSWSSEQCPRLRRAQRVVAAARHLAVDHRIGCGRLRLRHADRRSAARQ